LTEVRAELEDRYGKPPESVLHLLIAGEIRLTCEMLGIAQIERKRTVIEEPKKAATVPPARPNAQRLGFGSWSAAQPQRPPLAGRYGQAPQTANLQFSTRAATNRPVTNATVALRETAAVRPANAPAMQAGKMKPMRDMLYVTFSEKLHAAPAEEGRGVNVGAMMKLVARNAKNGAQLTPQGTLRWPLSNSKADVVLAETRELLEMLRPKDIVAS
jgi:transcription-repair coupling factor (superfamily II helicase)